MSDSDELARLLEMGRWLDERPVELGGACWAEEWAGLLLQVRGRDGALVPLRANRAQRAFEMRRGRENIVLKARQMGLTTWVAGRFFLKTITARGVLTVQVAQTREAAEGIFRMVERMWLGLPEAWREGPLRRSRANVGQMVFPALDSEFRVVSAGDENAGRGWTIQNLHLSEVSRWPGDAAAVLAGLRAALAPGGELVMESTACGAYGAFYEEWMRAGEELPLGGGSSKGEIRGFFPFAALRVRMTAEDEGDSNSNSGDNSGNDGGNGGAGSVGGLGDVGMVRHFLPWWLEERYVGPVVGLEAMRDEELMLVAREGLTGAQIGFRRGLERRFGELRAQEFAEDAASCFRATGMGCFDLAAVERRLAEVRGAAYAVRRGGALRAWLPPVAGRAYVVSVDPAGGGAAGDFCAVQVLDVATGMQCAEGQERLTVREAARVAAALGREYGIGSPGGEAWVVVERNNHGSGVLAELRSAERYGRVWCAVDGEAGWLTTAANKPEMVALVGALLAERCEAFRSERLLAEMRTFVAFGGGRTGAAAGGHDDLVMAFAVGQMVRAEMVGGRG